ncbi:MAG: PhzF family phenazine biosynthesis protein [Catenulispora sp.]|nr:PhzF family phenazine biosynthesis protein [Catenulispora sp.]
MVIGVPTSSGVPSSSGVPAVSAPDVTLVDACLREGAGGSPTAVIISDTPVPVPPAASHLAVIAPQSPDGIHRIRFFTSAGELPNCGHGTIAALAVLVASQLATSELATDDSFAGRLAIGGRLVEAVGRPLPGGGVEAWFDQGTVTVAKPDDAAVADVLGALGLDTGDLDDGDLDNGDLDKPFSPVIASPGRPRLLLPLRSPVRLAAVVPDQARLAEVSARHDVLGCFAYARRDEGRSSGRLAARMFAPAIGVPEDVANANSSGCLAAYLLSIGENPAIAVDQGDTLGRPSTVYAEASYTPDGIRTRVGGVARLR